MGLVLTIALFALFFYITGMFFFMVGTPGAYRVVCIVLGVVCTVITVLAAKSELEDSKRAEIENKEKQERDKRRYEILANPNLKYITDNFIVNTTKQEVIINERYTVAFDNIISYNIQENGNTISETHSKTEGGASIGRAVVGGVLFGGVGAVIGGTTGARNTNSVTNYTDKCTELYVNITVNNLYTPLISINMLEREYVEVNKDSYTYRTATRKIQEISSYLDYIINNNKS